MYIYVCVCEYMCVCVRCASVKWQRSVVCESSDTLAVVPFHEMVPFGLLQMAQVLIGDAALALIVHSAVVMEKIMSTRHGDTLLPVWHSCGLYQEMAGRHWLSLQDNPLGKQW